jgi:hypothetical protein
MGKLLDYANLGMNMYQTKQLSTISAAHDSLATAHMIEGMAASNEVSKRQLMLQFESEMEALDFSQNEMENAMKLIRIRDATDSLNLTVNGFREFADMDRAKDFNKSLSDWEQWMVENITSDTISSAKMLNQYIMEDDDLEEYAALQYVKEAEDKEMNMSLKAMGWLFVSGMIGVGIPYGIAGAMGIDTAEPPDWVLQSFCGFSILFLAVLWKPFGMSVENIQALLSDKAMKDAKKILKKGGGQEALDNHIVYFGEMTSDEASTERMRRLEFVVEHID